MIILKNYSRVIWIIVLILNTHTLVIAQDSVKLANITTISSLTKIKLTFLGIGLEREQKIGRLTTAYAGLSMDVVFPFEPKYKPNRSDALSLWSFVGITPIMYSGIRRYYNLQKRAKNNRNTMNNSSEYFGIEINALSPITSTEGEYNTLWTFSFAPNWGIQRSLSKRVSIDLTLGPALKTNLDVTKLFPFFRMGYSFLL